MKTFTLACTVALSFTTLSLAHAADDAIPTRQVRFGDLDLSRTEGKAALYGRLVSASQSVCQKLDPSLSSHNLLLKDQYRDCVQKAIVNAVANVNRPEFTAYVASKQPTDV